MAAKRGQKLCRRRHQCIWIRISGGTICSTGEWEVVCRAAQKGYQTILYVTKRSSKIFWILFSDSAVHPYLEVLSALYDIIMWKNPLSTLLLVLVIVYSLFRGWLAALLLGLLLFQLNINYLYTVRNIDLGWMFMPRKQVILPKFDISGAQLIFDIAKLAQKLLRLGTNILEKIESLLLWKNVRVTRVFYILVVYWFGWSVLFATGTCIGWTVLTIGIRIFFTTYLFQRFPRLRKRFDTYGYFYRNLPLRSANTAATPRSQPQSSRTERSMVHQEMDERCVGLIENLSWQRESFQHTPSSRSLNAYCGEKFESRLGSNFNLDQGAAVNLLLGPHHRPHSHTQSLHYDSNQHLDSDNLDSPLNDQTSSEAHPSIQLHGSHSLPTSDQLNVNRVFSDHTTHSRTHTTSKSSSIEEDEEDENEHTSLCADPIIDNVIACESDIYNFPCNFIFSVRSCVMNERERLFPMGITPGILYLTDAALVFRPRNQTDEKEQLMMLFHDLKLVRKVPDPSPPSSSSFPSRPNLSVRCRSSPAHVKALISAWKAVASQFNSSDSRNATISWHGCSSCAGMHRPTSTSPSNNQRKPSFSVNLVNVLRPPLFFACSHLPL